MKIVIIVLSRRKNWIDIQNYTAKQISCPLHSIYVGFVIKKLVRMTTNYSVLNAFIFSTKSARIKKTQEEKDGKLQHGHVKSVPQQVH